LRAVGRAAGLGDAIPADTLVRLLFGDNARNVPPDVLHYAVTSGFVRDLRQVRALLGAAERQASPSPVTVRFGPDDVRFEDFGAFQLALDRADRAISRVIMEQHGWEPHTTAVFERSVRPGMTVVDIGANLGWFTMVSAALVGQEGRVIAVEPWSENCRLLLMSARRNGFDHVELWPVALDTTRGWAHFSSHVGSNGGLIGDDAAELASGRGTVVPTFTLDEMLLAEDRVDFVKIDVEGAEHRVLMGAQRTIEQWRPIVLSEFSLEMSHRVSGIDPIEYLDWFTAREWRVHVVQNPSGELLPFESGKDLLAWWPAHPHHEDLLFLPEP